MISISYSSYISSCSRVVVSDGGRLFISRESFVDRYCKIVAKYGLIDIGENTFIGQSCVICSQSIVSIGKNCLIAENVSIRDQDHAICPGKPRRQQGFSSSPIRIGNNVWIGAGAVVLQGVSIGDNSIIGANAVVLQDLPSNVLAAGVPAVIKKSLMSPLNHEIKTS